MNRLQMIKRYDNRYLHNDNRIALLHYSNYKKRDNLSNSKSGEVIEYKTKKKSKKAIKEIYNKNVRLAMYGLY